MQDTEFNYSLCTLAEFPVLYNELVKMQYKIGKMKIVVWFIYDMLCSLQ